MFYHHFKDLHGMDSAWFSSCKVALLSGSFENCILKNCSIKRNIHWIILKVYGCYGNKKSLLYVYRVNPQENASLLSEKDTKQAFTHIFSKHEHYTLYFFWFLIKSIILFVGLLDFFTSRRFYLGQNTSKIAMFTLLRIAILCWVRNWAYFWGFPIASWLLRQLTTSIPIHEAILHVKN